MKKRLVVIVAPHTSNWDGILGVAALAGLDAKITLLENILLLNMVLGHF